MSLARQLRVPSTVTFALVLVMVLASVGQAAPSAADGGSAASPRGIGAGVRLDGTVKPVLLRAGTRSAILDTPVRQASAKSLAAPLSTFSVNYLPADTVFKETYTCQAWPAEARAAFDYAASIWGSLLKSSVPIAVDACWTPLDPGVAGGAWPEGYRQDFSGAPVAKTWYPNALANALYGSDVDPELADINAVFASGFDWYLGTTGTPGPGQFDFSTAVLRELGYGLGYVSSMTVGDGIGSWGWGSGYPFAYDLLCVNGSGQSLVSAFPNQSTELAAQIQSDDVYSDGAQAKAANAGSRPKLFAPSPWLEGWSLSYLDPIFDDTPNALMTSTLAPEEVVHDPGPIGLAILHDVGWPNTTAITDISPTIGSVTESVIIRGTGLAAATSVKFNGVSASFAIVSAAEISAVVPSGATTGPITVATPSGTATSIAAFTVTTAQTIFLPKPVRLVDTRASSGYQGSGQPLNGYTSYRRFMLAGNSGIPANATAVLVNLTAVGYSADGWLAAYPACTARPATSNVNFDTVENAIANFAIVRLGIGSGCQGAIDVTGADGANVVVDAVGYLVSTASDQVVLLGSPQRVVDTRPSSGFQGAGLSLNGYASSRRYSLAGQNGVPADAIAVLVNLTAVDHSVDGWLSAYPACTPWPGTSSLNFDTSENAIANFAIVKLGVSSAGSGCGGAIEVTGASGTNVVVDVTGYLRSTANPQIVLLDSPRRLVDTRSGSGYQGQGQSLQSTSSPMSYQIAGQGGVPGDARGVIGNLTAVDYTADGWIAAYPNGQGMPATSSVNYDTQENAIANTAIVRLGAGGTASGRLNLVASSSTDAIVDVSAYLR